MRISDWSSDVCSSDLLSETIFVIPDEKVRAIEHVLRRSEVLLKTHGVRIPALLEFEDIFDLGMAPGVNQLLLVADNGDVRIVAKIGRASCRERVCQYV